MGVEIKDNKVTLLEAPSGGQKYPTKYSFFIKKQNGKTSKAYEQYDDLEVKAGDVVDIAVSETQGTNAMSGKPVTYRNVMFFYTDGKMEQNAPVNGDRMDKMAQWAVKMSKDFTSFKEKTEADIAGIKDMISADGNPAYEVSKALDAPIKKKIFAQPELPTIDLDEVDSLSEMEDEEEKIPIVAPF